jgi:hypothetical protein
MIIFITFFVSTFTVQDHFSAFAYHKENKKVWTIDANGIVEQSPSKPKKHRNWQGSGEISIGTNENI